MKKESPSYLNFDKSSYGWRPDIDYRERPELYRVGKGEQGVLICEPYKSEILPFWRFQDEDIAEVSSMAIFDLFQRYMDAGDFVGADMARKFLQMGFTRARRYANYRGGRKYDKANDYEVNQKGTGDPEKAKAAAVFYEKWQRAEENLAYKQAKVEWKKRYG